jgi:uncharacterized protein (TIGR00369 family)
LRPAHHINDVTSQFRGTGAPHLNVWPMPDSDKRTQGQATALARGWLENSPFVAHLGIGLELLEPGRAVLSMPFSGSLPTMGDVIHGGAISALVDTAAAAAAWSGAEVPERPRASTVGITVDFLRPARGQGVRAYARVVRRGGSGLCFCEVKVAAEGGTAVATALVT